MIDALDMKLSCVDRNIVVNKLIFYSLFILVVHFKTDNLTKNIPYLMPTGKFSYILMELKGLHTNFTFDIFIQKWTIRVYNLDWKASNDFFWGRSNLSLISSAKNVIGDDFEIGEICSRVDYL